MDGSMRSTLVASLLVFLAVAVWQRGEIFPRDGGTFVHIFSSEFQSLSESESDTSLSLSESEKAGATIARVWNKDGTQCEQENVNIYTSGYGNRVCQLLKIAASAAGSGRTF
eukprot:SAG11_NODE_27240_length_335_cov_0.652542_1_plen_111_part_11